MSKESSGKIMSSYIDFVFKASMKAGDKKK